MGPDNGRWAGGGRASHQVFDFRDYFINSLVDDGFLGGSEGSENIRFGRGVVLGVVDADSKAMEGLSAQMVDD